MKGKRSLLSLILLCASLFVAAGCSNTKSVKHITDIAKYENMQSGGDRIEVDFENGKQYGYKFTIEDRADIDEIVHLVLTTRLINLGKNSPDIPGDNTRFTIYQGDNIYTVALSGMMSNNNRYAFSTNDLREKIYNIAVVKGAFDTEVGVIYKVIDLQNIKEVKEEKITVVDKTAVLTLLENSYGDCEYFYLYDSKNLAEYYYSSGITENESADCRYTDTVTMGKDRLLLMYRIYQNYNETTYYITGPSMGEYVDNGNTMRIDFSFGFWHKCYLNIDVVS